MYAVYLLRIILWREVLAEIVNIQKMNNLLVANYSLRVHGMAFSIDRLNKYFVSTQHIVSV